MDFHKSLNQLLSLMCVYIVWLFVRNTWFYFALFASCFCAISYTINAFFRNAGWYDMGMCINLQAFYFLLLNYLCITRSLFFLLWKMNYRSTLNLLGKHKLIALLETFSQFYSFVTRKPNFLHLWKKVASRMRQNGAIKSIFVLFDNVLF